MEFLNQNVFQICHFCVSILLNLQLLVMPYLTPEWKKAMEVEIQALLRNDTWELVPYTEDMNVVTNKWVFRVKYKVDGSVDMFKARLVAKRFQ